MIFEKFSPKQTKSMLWWKLPETKNYDAVICDGSVRSGKSLSMTIGFMLWSCTQFNGQTFAICGKTAGSIQRNVILPMQKWLEGTAVISLKLSRSFFDVKMNGHTNRYYFFGGKDESSYTLIQGMTLAGVMFDEVALMPKSFVEQALARCSVKGSKFWFNCNPDTPAHWFYNQWILKNQDKNALYLHFTMDDNFSLDPKIKKRYESLYAGSFYDRYILGKWAAAEGLVYPMFSLKEHISGEVPNGDYYISIDYGTHNPTSIGLWVLTYSGHAYRIKESYYDGRKNGVPRTDEEHYQELEKLAGEYADLINYVVVDPSAASFIECIHRHRKFRVRKADNSVIDGIRDVQSLLKLGYLHFSPECKDIIREFGLYRWNEKAEKDTVIKENDHAMDDMRYFVRTVMYRILREIREEEDKL
jgi:PBSX family phage terminase large subunit